MVGCDRLGDLHPSSGSISRLVLQYWIEDGDLYPGTDQDRQLIPWFWIRVDCLNS